MKALAYALLLVGTVLVAVSRARAQVMVVSSQTAVDADDNELSPSTAAVLATTRDSLSPADQSILQEMLQESEGVTLVDENGDSLEGEIEAEADSLAEAAEEAEDEAEAEEDGDHSVVAAEIPGTAQAVHLAEEDELAEAGETVEAEDLDASEEDEDEGDAVEEAEAEADAALADESEDAAFLQVDEADMAVDESEDEDEDEEEEADEDEDESEEETALVQSDEHILSVPEAEAHHMLLSVQEPAAAFLQVAQDLEDGEEAEDDAEAEVSDSAEQFEAAEAGEAQVSDSADNGSELGEGWGEEFSDSDPYAFLQVDEQEGEGEGEEELLYADSGAVGPLVDAPLNAVTSTSQTAAQIHAALDEARNAETAAEFRVESAAPAHSDAAEAEADTDTSEEMEVNDMGEGVWEDIKADVAASASPPKYGSA